MVSTSSSCWWNVHWRILCLLIFWKSIRIEIIDVQSSYLDLSFTQSPRGVTQNPESYFLVYLNLTQEARRRVRFYSPRNLKEQKRKKKKPGVKGLRISRLPLPRRATQCFCEFLRGSHFALRSVVGLGFVKWCSIVLLKGWIWSQEPLLGKDFDSNWWQLCVNHISMNFHIRIQKVKKTGPNNFPFSLKKDAIPGGKKMIKRKERRIQEGRDQRTFLRLPFAFLWICHLVSPSVWSISLFPHCWVLSTACSLILLLTGLSSSLFHCCSSCTSVMFTTMAVELNLMHNIGNFNFVICF